MPSAFLPPELFLRLPCFPLGPALLSSCMEKYSDTPMDLGDASLVVAAEAHGLTKVFTLDSDFRVYRLSNGSAFDIEPQVTK